MTTGRKWLIWGLTLCLLLSAGGVIRHQWQQLLHRQGVESLDWTGLDLSLRGLSLRQLSLHQRNDAGTLLLEAEGIRLSLPGLWHPLPPDALHIVRLTLDWRPAPETTDTPDPFQPPSRQQLERWLDMAPRRLTVDQFELALPCASGRCREQGSLAWRHAGRALFPASLTLRLQREPHVLALTASASGSLELADLNLQLALDDQPRLFSRHRLSREDRASQWRGTLAMGRLPEAPWLLDWLARWLPQEPPSLPAPPEDMRLGASWNLQLPGDDWRNLYGDFATSLHLPAPWPVIGLGQLQGRLDLAAHRQAEGPWQPEALNADLQLQPAPERLEALPSTLRPERIHLRLAPVEDELPPGTPLPLRLDLDTEGDIALNLQAPRLLLDTRTLSLAFDEARLGLRSRKLPLAGVRLDRPRADLRLGGQVGAERIALRALSGSSLQLATVTFTDLPELSIQALRGTLAGLSLEATRAPDGLMAFALAGPLRLEAGNLQHPQLLPQPWQWQGRLDTDLERLSLDGRLSNAAQLQLSTRLDRTPTGHLAVAAGMPEFFLRAGNPFARTFSAWPALLELNTGRLALNATLGLPPGGTPDLRLDMHGRGIGGIHDRVELSGLDTHLALTLRNRQLRLDPLELRLAQANPGFVFGPLVLYGRYQAAVAQPARGRLGWREARVEALGGRLFAEPGELDLSAPRLRLPLRLEGLDLGRLLVAYPAQGLEGSGIIDGRFELQHGSDGPSIDNGSLAARAPGGVLRFDSPRIRALGQSNPAMRLVTEALENFHYDLLASDVRYGVDGRLQLGLRLHGRNPALENGRPIHFNINLEEDIPALLTSLQLSDRVSETIQRRVQERLRNGDTPASP